MIWLANTIGKITYEFLGCLGGTVCLNVALDWCPLQALQERLFDHGCSVQPFPKPRIIAFVPCQEQQHLAKRSDAKF